VSKSKKKEPLKGGQGLLRDREGGLQWKERKSWPRRDEKAYFKGTTTRSKLREGEGGGLEGATREDKNFLICKEGFVVKLPFIDSRTVWGRRQKKKKADINHEKAENGKWR